MIERDEIDALNNREMQVTNAKSLEEQLADAQREIADLKSQIMWMNRSFE